MGIKEILSRIMAKPEEEDYVPKQVIDRYLDSLRRQRQVQLNEVEREQLKKAISKYQLERERKYLWGLKDKKEKKKRLLGNLKRAKVNILKERTKILNRKSLLNNRKEEFKKVDVLSDNSSILR